MLSVVLILEIKKIISVEIERNSHSKVTLKIVVLKKTLKTPRKMTLKSPFTVNLQSH